MSGEQDHDLQQTLSRLEELIQSLDKATETPEKELAREIASVVLELHCDGLAKVLDVLKSSQDGEALLARLVADEQIRSMLLLHGLHPEPLRVRVSRALDSLRPHLGVHGMRLELIDIEDGNVRLRLASSASELPKATLLMTLPSEIENAIFDAAPDVNDVTVDGLESLAKQHAATQAAE